MRRSIRDKRDRVRQLRVFAEVVRAGSISEAAERLGITQPAVSIQVRELEHELDVLLLERGATGTALTQAGEQLHALAAPLVSGVDALFSDLRHTLGVEDTGPVRVAVSSVGASFVLPRYVSRFLERHPDTLVRLDTVVFSEGIKRLLTEQVDFALGVRDLQSPEQLDYHELCTYGLVLITALDHPLAGRASVTPSEVSEFRSVIAPEHVRSRQFAQGVAREFGIDKNAVVETGGWGVLKCYVEAGIGVSVVPGLCVEETDRLWPIALDAWFPRRSYGVFTLRDRLLTPAAQRFFETLIPNAGASDSEEAASSSEEAASSSGKAAVSSEDAASEEAAMSSSEDAARTAL